MIVTSKKCMWARRCGRVALSAMLAPMALSASAQDYPSKVVRMVVPFPAGGSTDVLARLISQKLNQIHGSLPRVRQTDIR
jgi:tripartite-type tricarboxylate transporter receptor subunit TctC